MTPSICLKSHNWLALLPCIALGLVTGCDGVSGPRDLRVVSTWSHVVAPVGVPMPIDLVRLGGGRNATVSPEDVTWTSSDDAIAHVESTPRGLAVVVGRAPGRTTLSGAYRGAAVTVPVIITDAVALDVAVAFENVIPAGSKRRLGAYATFDDGTRYDVSSIATFTSASTAIATVETTKVTDSGDASLHAMAVGETEVVADLPTLAGTPATVIITDAELFAIEVTDGPFEAILDAPARFRAEAYYTDGSTADVTDSVTWSIDIPRDNTGLPIEVEDHGDAILGAEPGVVIPTNAGEFGIYVELDGVEGHNTITVPRERPIAIEIVHQNGYDPIELPVGVSQGLRSWFVLPDGRQVTANSYVVWSTDSENATIANARTEAVFMTAHAPGPVTIVASFGDLVGEFPTNVIESDLVSIGLWYATSPYIVPMGGGLQITPFARFSNGTTYDILHDASYASSDPSGLVVDATTGWAFGRRPGVYEVTVSARGVSETFDLGIGPVSLPVFLDEVTLTVGETYDLTAMASLPNGDPVDLHRFVTWTSGDESVVTVSDERETRGRILAVAPGDAYVSPEYMGNRSPTRVFVLPAP